MEHNGILPSSATQEPKDWSGFDATIHDPHDTFHADGDDHTNDASTEDIAEPIGSFEVRFDPSKRVIGVEASNARIHDLRRKLHVVRRERFRATLGTTVSWLTEGAFISYVLIQQQTARNPTESLHAAALALTAAFFLSITAEMGIMPSLRPTHERSGDEHGEASAAKLFPTTPNWKQTLCSTLFSVCILGVLLVRLRVFGRTENPDFSHVGMFIVSLTAVMGSALLTGLLGGSVLTKTRDARDLQNQIWKEQLTHELLLLQLKDEEWADVERLSSKMAVARQSTFVGAGWSLPWFGNRNARDPRPDERGIRRKLQADLTSLKRRHDAETKTYRAALTECVHEVRTEHYIRRAIWSTAWELANRELERREGPGEGGR